MSTAEELLETAEDTATKKVHQYLDGKGQKPEPSVWLQMLSETNGIVMRVSHYYLDYDGSVEVAVISKGYTDHHSHESAYVESLLDYYEPEPVYEKEAPAWVSNDD